MKNRNLWIGRAGVRRIVWVAISLAVGGLWTLPLRAQAVRTEELNLEAGWNAVFLEIDPQPGDPAELFAGKPVDVVAAYAQAASRAQFVQNPRADMLAAYGWAVWYAPERPDSFLTTLYGIQGAQPYLVHATTNTTLSISGTQAPVRPTWTPDAYNLVGFAVQDPGGPTFEQFFKGDPALAHDRIYRLVQGTWRKVVDPGGELMRSGEAFWIYCEGRSRYSGPLQVSAPSAQGISLSANSPGEVVIRNRTDHPVGFFVEHVTDPDRPVPLSASVRVVNEAAGGSQDLNVHFEAGDWRQDFPPLEAGGAIRFPVRLRTRDMESGTRESLLKVVSDMGTIHWIPVTAMRDGP